MYSIRLSKSEYELLKQESIKQNKPISYIFKQGLQSYFQLESDKQCKLKGQEVWKERNH